MPFPTGEQISDLCDREKVTDSRVRAWLLRECTLLTTRQIAAALDEQPSVISMWCADIDRDREFERARRETDRLREIAKHRPGVVNQATPEQIANVMRLVPQSHRQQKGKHHG